MKVIESKLFELLRAIRREQRNTIKRRSHSIADLAPSENAEKQNTLAAIKNMGSIHKISGVDDVTVSEWIAEGRR
jgi:hypothetical protein